jgi:DNA-binding NtrC family response regulator
MDAQTRSDVSSTQAEPRSVHPEQQTEAGVPYFGLLAAHAIQELLAHEWQRARDSRSRFSVILLRSLGRGELAQAPQLAAAFGELCPAARIGTYDRHALLAVCRGTEPERAVQIARTLAVRVSGRGHIVCGVAVHPETASSPAQLLSAAERAARRASAFEPVVLAPALPYVSEAKASHYLRSPGPLAHLLSGWQAESRDARALFVLGDAGTGKEVVARELHFQGPRRNGPFKTVHCAAIPVSEVERILFGHVRADNEKLAGVFEQAQGGTLFFDDISALPAGAQAAIARVISAGKLRALDGSELTLDLQCIASTDRDPAAAVVSGMLDRELCALLSRTILRVPQLRQRRDEIMPLAEYFAASISAQWGSVTPRINDEARAVLSKHDWTGNVSELRHVIERAVALAEDDVITPAELPEHLRGVPGSVEHLRITANGKSMLDLRARLQDHEALLIRQALQLSRGNQRKAALLLKLPLRTLERKLRNLGGRERLMAS